MKEIFGYYLFLKYHIFIIKLQNSFVPNTKLTDVSVIYQDKKNNFWFGTYTSGLYKKEYESNKITLIIKPQQIGSIYSITENDKGEIWLTSKGKIVCVNTETNKINEFFPDNKANSITNYGNIVFDNYGNQWVGSYWKWDMV